MKLVINNESPVSQLDFDSPILEKRQPINRFVLGSILLHAITTVTVLMLKPNEPVKNEVIEIEIAAGTPSTVLSAPLYSEIAQEAAPAIVQAPSPTQPIVAPQPQQETQPASAQPQPDPIVTSATVEDIELPQLEKVVATVDAQPTQESNEQLQNELNEKLMAAQAAEAKQLELAQKQMQEDLENAQALAQAEAAAEEQKAEDERAAQAAASALAAEKAAMAAAQGNAEKSSAPTENTGELRSLAQLKQKPGNPRPSYDAQERLEGHNGAVIFKAFVTQDGGLKDFRMIQSSGYKNLDFKTLRALKQWKFYPGQEGWVELPFQWDLKGGPQEMPTLLRRRVGQN